MSAAPAKRVAISPILYMALSALLWPRAGYSALPPATAVGTEEKAGASQSAATQSGSGSAEAATGPGMQTTWMFPPIRWGGMLSYDWRSTNGEGQDSLGRGLMATLLANTQGYIWQPWFSRVNANLSLSTSRSSSSSTDANGHDHGTSSRSVSVAGSGQLNLIPYSRFPFEAHVSRSDGRAISDLSLPVDYVSQNVGFSQKFPLYGGDGTFGYDHARQSSSDTGETRQDTVQMSFAKNLVNHRFQLTGNGSHNGSNTTGDFVKQGNLTLQHSYGTGGYFSLDNLANVSKSDYYLGRSQSGSRLSQLGTQAFWRSTESPLSVTGGARVLTATAIGSTSGVDGASFESRINTANGNIGANYDISQFFHVYAAVNANVSENQDKRIHSNSESAGAMYAPDAIQLGGFQYRWSVSGGASNQSAAESSARQWNTNVNHGISRNYGAISVDANQALSVMGTRATLQGQSVLTRTLTNGAGVGWSRAIGTGNAMARLSVSDSRSLEGAKEYFQMVNLQLSGNVQTGTYSTWTGSLTMQATRQGASEILVTTNESGQSTTLLNPQRNTSTKSSSGSLSYQNGRFFGLRNLRFGSDLRLNSQGLLPILGSPKDQETAAWESHLDYSIGRTQLRAGMIIARVVLPSYSTNPDGTIQLSGISRTNKAIMFTVSRAFGNY